ncbi:MAG: VRR-NUC domain-containing protein [Bryobacteraceae bacterium]
MTAPALKERDITRTVRDYLELRGWRPVRINAGPFGANGMPDYLFLHYQRNLCFWVEMKSPNGRLGPKQQSWIEAERRRGATVVVCRDIDSFFAWYEERFGKEGQMRLHIK